ncbi:NAD(P)/FAD-dependent oxidoreductase [Caldimonas tepidiphila]|uniref:NAD(P)/FAD-dependent oxidoreductase n=1 Tax=Caldimonas tepidiphila TaxID=2315841 RepID=UPI000E5BB55C|nr:NAD(P)/FAD-dependent oxidoreductase [Caldimonas tepidiphila]
MNDDASLPTAEARPAAPIETDALVIGAGPAGLFQVFELGLLEIGAHVVDSLPYVGGQCIELYPDKPIYDIPGVPRCTGRELVALLTRQIEPFGTPFHLGQQVSVLRRREDGRFDVETSAGLRFLARTVIVAGGVGSFQPRRLTVEGLERFEGSQVLYRVANPAEFAGRRVMVVGGDETALDRALEFAQDEGPQRAASVTLLHRRNVIQAPPGKLETMRALCDAGRLQFLVGQVSGVEASGERLDGVQLTDSEGKARVVPLDVLLVQLGVSPKLGPIAEWGMALERKQVVVDTEKFETSVPGLFAVGDIVTYPGKRKLLLCGFHEATLAAFGIAAHLLPGQRIPLEYTTTSTRLHKVLRVAAPPAGD